ncbi:hypothetical protein K440DRAFT_646440 [Wilcoxina mikolae CBS 423.85]|nr:hypothetical protein K440DRAFT_646440 [Wilcoxina mikolae CBS 423.85]
MTEEQRMEEGRRMFQIFAARMFEQRVLTAYREKVARERQRKLLEELEEEERRKEEREEKKAKDKDKKKEKKRQQKQAKEEERLRKEAEKREEEEKQRAIEARKSEEQRRRKEEQRLKREAERKAVEEEKQRKEEEKRKRLQEEREREAERERKRKEHQERERKKREEAAKKAREEKEARERELREKREREDREKREREAKAKKDAAEKEKKRKEEEAKARADASAAAAKRSQAFAQPTISHTQTAPPPGYGSPHLPVVTPATPKQSAGAQLHGSRPRNSSQQGSIQGSQCSSPKTPSVGPRIGTSASPSTPVLQQSIPGPTPVKGFQFPGFLQTSPMPHHIGPPPGVTPPEGIFSMSPMGMNGPNPMQPFLPGMPQRQTIGNGIPIFSPGQMPIGHSPQYRGFASNGLPMPIPQPPGMRPMSNQGRGGLFMPEMPHHLPPGVPLPPPGSPFINRVDPIPMSGHSRIPSGSFDPMHRPTPIQRPSSVAPPRTGDDQLEELSKVMGSRALLEDDDEPLPENMSPVRRVSGPQFAPRPIRGVPSSSVLFGDTLGGFNDFGVGASWSNPLPLGGSLSGSLPSAWANKAGWSDIDAGTYNRRRTTRVDTIRLLACQKFRELSGPSNQPVEISTLQRAIQQTAPPELQFKLEELPYTLDVEGDPQNGGGSFEQRAENGRILVYYSSNQNSHGPIRAGEIGSPSTTGAVPFKTPLGAPPGMASPAGF